MPKTLVEFRLWEEEAQRYLGPHLRHRIIVDADSELFEKIGEANRTMWQKGEGSVFSSWDIRRRYSRRELDEAELFHSIVRWRFEPTGEEFGELYDYSAGCPICRVGRRQIADLTLDLSKVPRKDVAITIGGEIVVSERFVDIVQRANLTGFALGPVHHYRTTERELAPRWQLIVEPPGVPVLSPPTQFGNNPFDFDADGEYQCPNGRLCHRPRLAPAETPTGASEPPALKLRPRIGDMDTTSRLRACSALQRTSDVV